MKTTLEPPDKFHVVAAQGWLELGDHRERKQRSNVRMAWSSGLTTRMSHDEERINGDRTRNEVTALFVIRISTTAPTVHCCRLEAMRASYTERPATAMAALKLSRIVRRPSGAVAC